MTLYTNALRIYGRAFITIEAFLLKIMVWFNVDLHVKQIQEARKVAMAKNLELLIKNIKACKYGFELKACRDLYQLICLQYQEFPLEYNKLIGDTLKRQEDIISKSFKK